MVLENMCGPVILYLGFSLIQIIVDIYKNLFNTAFLKFIVMVVFALILNILCSVNLTIVSWFLVFIPFIFMTFITSVLLFVFGLNPDQGTANYIIDEKAKPIAPVQPNLYAPLTSHDNRIWRVYGENNQTTTISLLNGNFNMFGVNYQLEDTNPISFNLPDGSVQYFVSMDNYGNVTWQTTSKNLGYTYLYWTPIGKSTIPGVPTPPSYNPEILGPGGEEQNIPILGPGGEEQNIPILGPGGEEQNIPLTPPFAPAAQPLNPTSNVAYTNEINCDFQCIADECLNNSILDISNCIATCKNNCSINNM